MSYNCIYKPKLKTMKSALYYKCLVNGVDKLRECFDCVLESDRDVIQNIIDKYNSEIEAYNCDNVVAINSTRTERGLVRSAIKKMVIGYFIDKDYYYRDVKVESEYSDYIGDYTDLDLVDEGYDSGICEVSGYSERYQEDYSVLRKVYDRDVSEFKKRCESTIISDDIIDAKILLGRKSHELGYDRKLGLSMEKYLRVNILLQFQEQNKSFINQKQKQYETIKC